jgi:MscS family membrane protein
MPITIKIIITAGLLVVSFLFNTISNRLLKRFAKKYSLRRVRRLVIQKIKTAVILVIAALIIIYIWGLELENIWIFVTGFLGLVAIGLFAVWSILSNVFAGVVIFFTQPFVIDDTIRVLPDNVSGTVTDITLFFVKIKTDEGGMVSIPSNIIFQRMIERLPG